MYNITIIGAGQLGSRHLQGLARMNSEITIEVVDLSNNSLELAKERYSQIPHNNNIKSIKFCNTIDEINYKQNLVIIATNANIRYEVVIELINKKQVENLVLEKIVFQDIQKFEKTIKLINSKGINCWVNCTRRMFSFYQNIKDELKGKKFNISVQGGAWGMACNSIHYLDLFAFLSDNLEINLDVTNLYPEIYNSKREGYVEVNGLMLAQINNNTMSLYSSVESGKDIITIKSDDFLYVIDEGDSKISKFEKNNNWELIEEERKIIYFQSELTNILAEDILINKSCKLPLLEESFRIHIPLLENIKNHINKYSEIEYNNCPIT
jgi:predicted dehydrogenase